MRERVVAVLAFVVLTGFLGILLWKVPRWDLGIIIGITLLLAAYDFLSSAGRKKDPR